MRKKKGGEKQTPRYKRAFETQRIENHPADAGACVHIGESTREGGDGASMRAEYSYENHPGLFLPSFLPPLFRALCPA